jgi:hypothetical protein
MSDQQPQGIEAKLFAVVYSLAGASSTTAVTQPAGTLQPEGHASFFNASLWLLLRLSRLHVPLLRSCQQDAASGWRAVNHGLMQAKHEGMKHPPRKDPHSQFGLAPAFCNTVS